MMYKLPFQIRTVLSSPEETNSPVGKTSTEYTNDVCPYISNKQSPFKDHILKDLNYHHSCFKIKLPVV